MVVEDKEYVKGFYFKNIKIMNFMLNVLKYYYYLLKDY